MIQIETLSEIDGEHEKYEDPDGELLDFVGQNSNSISVLTKVDGGKPAVESPPVDPTDLTVSELKDALDDEDYDWNQRAYLGLLQAERNGKDRATATYAIEERLDPVE